MTDQNQLKETKTSVVLALTIMILASLLPLLAGELGTRIYRGQLLSTDSVRYEITEEISGPRADYHPQLGYVPKPGIRQTHFRSTISPEGFRSNGSQPPPDGVQLLAVGDSYTFGDDVNDEDAWPAHLESLTGRPVINAGVFGYGLDQSVLRGELLLGQIRADTLVISFIPDDLNRSELSYRYAWKPYFSIEEEELVLRNVPVPRLPPPVNYRVVRDLLSYSHLADAVFRRVAPDWWYLAGAEQRAHDDGVSVGRLLMNRLARAADRHGVRVLVVAQTDRSLSTVGVNEVLEAAESNGLETLDLAEHLARKIHADPRIEEEFFLGPFGGHMTSAGNRWVAEKIAAKLEDLEQGAWKVIDTVL